MRKRLLLVSLRYNCYPELPSYFTDVKTQDLIRISVGTEHIDDIIGDFEQSFTASAAAKTSGGNESNAAKTGDDTDAPMIV
jgi:Cys/Met metabolism PLP-dependent enzyme